MTISIDHCAMISHEKSGWNVLNIDKLTPIISHYNLEHIVIKSIADLDPVLEKLANQKIRYLIINTGDGTLDAVVAALRTYQYFKPEPVIIPLPGGTTNMTHRSLGFRKSPDVLLPRILKNLIGKTDDQIPVVKKSPLKVKIEDAAYPVYGFFFATGAIPKAILTTRKDHHQKGRTGLMSEALSAGGLIWRLLWNKTTEDPVLKAGNLQYSFDNWTWNWFDNIFTYVTTLDHLLLGICPQIPENGFKMAGLNNPYKKLLFSLPKIWRGQANKEALGGVFAADIYEGLFLKTDSVWTLDGEIFMPDEGKTFNELYLEQDQPLRFLRLSGI